MFAGDECYTNHCQYLSAQQRKPVSASKILQDQTMQQCHVTSRKRPDDHMCGEVGIATSLKIITNVT